MSKDVEFNKIGTWNWNINIKEINKDEKIRIKAQESSSPPSLFSYHSSPAHHLLEKKT